MALLGIGLLLVAASLFIALFRRTRIPDVLLLMLIGLALGQVSGTVHPDDFGKAGGTISTIALTVILFESGLTMSLSSLRQAFGATLCVTLLAFVTTAAVVATCAHWLLGLPPLLALALGAILGGTSSAVVIPMVRQLGLAPGPATVLVLESGITDVLSIVVSAALLDAYLSGGTSVAEVSRSIATSFGVAAGLGTVAALGLLFAVGALRALPNPMVALVGVILFTFGAAEALGASGGVAALIFGFVVGNSIALGVPRLPGFSHVLALGHEPYVARFLGDLVFVLKTFFFVYLGILLRLSDWRLAGLAFGTMVAVYALRTGIVRLTLSPATTSREDASVMAVMAPKGLAAAVLAGVPLRMGIVDGALMQQFTLMTVLVSILLTAGLIPLLSMGPVGAVFGLVFGRYGAPGESGPLEAAGRVSTGAEREDEVAPVV